MNNLKIFLISIGGSLLAQSISQAESFSRELTHQWPVDTFSAIEIAVDRADINVEGWDKPIVQVVVSMEVNARNQENADASFNSFLLDVKEGEKLQLKLEGNRSKWSWLLFWRDRPSVSVDVRLPDNQNLSLFTGAGDVALSGLNASLTCATGAGDVMARAFTGTINISTGAGDVDFSGSLSRFRIATGAGDVALDSRTGPAERSAIATGKGDAVVTLSRNADFSLSADVGFGDISCDFPLLDVREEKSSLRGYTSSDAPEISLATGFGDISIRSSDWQEQ